MNSIAKNEANEFFHKHFDLHSQNLKVVVHALHVASQNDNCLHSEIAKVCGEIIDWDKRLVDFLNQLTKDLQQIGAENVSFKTNVERNKALRDRQVSWLSRALKFLVGEGFQTPPSPLKEKPLLDRGFHIVSSNWKTISGAWTWCTHKLLPPRP